METQVDGGIKFSTTNIAGVRIQLTNQPNNTP